MPKCRCSTAGPGGFGGNVIRQQRVGMEAVVADQHHGAIRAGQRQQTPQHHVVVAVAVLHDAGEHRRIASASPHALAGVVAHEAVARNGRCRRSRWPPGPTAPSPSDRWRRRACSWFRRRCRPGRAGSCPSLGRSSPSPGTNRLQDFAADFGGMHAQFGHAPRPRRAATRFPAAWARRAPVSRFSGKRSETIAPRIGSAGCDGHHPTTMTALPVLVQDVPERLGLAAQVADGANAKAVRSGFGEAMDAVLGRAACRWRWRSTAWG